MMQIKCECTLTITMDEATAGKLARSLAQLLNSTQHLDSKRYEQLVNAGAIDDLAALRTGILGNLPVSQDDGS